MANTDKDILITPNNGSSSADPKIEFKGADASTSAQTITATAYPTNNGTLSFDGSAGQLFSITNDMTGTIFSVNDVSGIPSIEVDDDGEVRFAEYSGDVVIGQSGPSYTTTDNASVISTISNNKLHVNGSIQLTNNNDAIAFGRGTGSFIRDEELGFGWGGGWYMTDGTYLRVRNNKHIYSTGDIIINNVDVSGNIQIGSEVVLQESTDRADLLQITSTTSGWGGLQIRNSNNEGRWSFMTDGETAGIYNDEDNQWQIYMVESGGTYLYYNGDSKINTQPWGATLTGTLVAGAVEIDGQLDIEEVHEKVTTDTTTTGTYAFDTSAQGIVYFTANQTANRTINFSNVNSTLGTGQSVTCSALVTNGSTAYYLNAYQVDGAAVTPKWVGGSAPSGGTASGIDTYTFTIIKTADATFTVLASLTSFS